MPADLSLFEYAISSFYGHEKALEKILQKIASVRRVFSEIRERIMIGEAVYWDSSIFESFVNQECFRKFDKQSISLLVIALFNLQSRKTLQLEDFEDHLEPRSRLARSELIGLCRDQFVDISVFTEKLFGFLEDELKWKNERVAIEDKVCLDERCVHMNISPLWSDEPVIWRVLFNRKKEELFGKNSARRLRIDSNNSDRIAGFDCRVVLDIGKRADVPEQTGRTSCFLCREDLVQIFASSNPQELISVRLLEDLPRKTLSPYRKALGVHWTSYFGHDKIRFRVEQSLNRSGNATLIIGRRHSGKTSTLNWLANRIEKSQVEGRQLLVVRIDMNSMDVESSKSPEIQFVEAFVMQLRIKREPLWSKTMGRRISTLSQLFEALDETWGIASTVVMLDELDAFFVDFQSRAERLMAKIRNYVQHHGLRAVFCGKVISLSKFQTMNGFTNFATIEYLGRLSENDAHSLVVQPMKRLGIHIEDALVDMLLTRSFGWANVIQKFCFEIVQSIEENRNPVVVIDFDDDSIDHCYKCCQQSYTHDVEHQILTQILSIKQIELALREFRGPETLSAYQSRLSCHEGFDFETAGIVVNVLRVNNIVYPYRSVSSSTRDLSMTQRLLFTANSDYLRLVRQWIVEKKVG